MTLLSFQPYLSITSHCYETYSMVISPGLRESSRVDDGERRLGRERGGGRHPVDVRWGPVLLHRGHHDDW